MNAGDIKNKVDKIWGKLWTCGVTESRDNRVIKIIKRRLAIGSLCILFFLMASSIPLERTIAKSAESKILVLAYHRIGDTADMLTRTREQFQNDLVELRNNGYSTISLQQAEDFFAGKDNYLPPKMVLLTFDDGYADNYENAFPILKQHGDVGTFFLITNLVDTPNRLSSMQIREMHAEGMSFGSHTATHPSMGELTDSQIEEELYQSKQFLKYTFGQPANAIAYPKGGYSSNVIKIAKKMNYTLGFTIKPGVCTSGKDLLELNRIPVFRYTRNIVKTINNSQK
ncbi:hypothetical protein AXX12_16290 [Anaerosporomusa subterranea]|uniref:NodB homology domain-containing protein n=1 Tax=Anaerosporomusa subterranea TaxID=1794912 RepID=A0A154BLI4_ANASB|nr:polysaccharide deacetylase family protein [Anaerosporomusa subterranea]KYZ74782.1 hypothetical protein AXX12_16290 [Anaerosporomusa subterranea]